MSFTFYFSKLILVNFESVIAKIRGWSDSIHLESEKRYSRKPLFIRPHRYTQIGAYRAHGRVPELTATLTATLPRKDRKRF